MSIITIEDIVFRDPKLNFSEIDGEVVMLSIANSEYYGLDEVGSVIWNKIGKPVKVSELIHELLNEFDVSEEKCRAETIEFLESLYTRNVIIKK